MTVLINGRPGSGKSTLAPRLGAALGLPTISRDAIKETHADVLGCEHPTLSQREWNRRLSAAASEAVWTLLSTMPNGAVIEAPYPVDVRHYVHQELPEWVETQRRLVPDWQLGEPADLSD